MEASCLIPVFPSRCGYFDAYAIRSNCICKQVGAVIVDKYNYIIGAGWNDVGEGHISCGLIERKDLEKSEFYDKYLSALGIEPGDDKKRIKDKLFSGGGDEYCYCFKDSLSKHKIEAKLPKNSKNDLNIKRLEYCRALHAEENAIIQTARRGGMGIQGAKIYTTLFPCELCAKKIVQSGIEEVVFCEPYPNPLSEIFLKDVQKNITLKQFEGVKPLGYFRLFKVDYDQKDWQKLANQEPKLVKTYKYTEL